jgi:NADH:ubiquinone oxidoreductase subunit 3 (subunit A)
MDTYIPVYLYFGLVSLITLLTLSLSALFRSRKKDLAVQQMPYESGIQTTTNLFSERFSLHYYLVALLFLVFDIEVVFLYPWAVIAKQLGMFGFCEIAFFLFILLIGFAYVWKKGGLEWQ